MVDTTLIYEMKPENPVTPDENIENPKPRGRGRPKKVKTPEEIEQDRIKYNEYQKNYLKQRIENDPEFAEKSRIQHRIRSRRYVEKNRDRLKQERDELVRKSKLFDEIVKNLSV